MVTPYKNYIAPVNLGTPRYVSFLQSGYNNTGSIHISLNPASGLGLTWFKPRLVVITASLDTYPEWTWVSSVLKHFHVYLFKV